MQQDIFLDVNSETEDDVDPIFRPIGHKDEMLYPDVHSDPIIEREYEY